jgi:urea transport system substrate-binding protein
VEAVKRAAAGVTLEAPCGEYQIDGDNQHLYKTARIGRVRADGLIDEVSNSGEPIKPDPFLKTYAWAKGLAGGG